MTNTPNPAPAAHDPVRILVVDDDALVRAGLSMIDHVTTLGGGPAAPDNRRERALRQLAGLSDREREVAVALGHGKTNAEISAELFMSVATVKAYVSRLLSRLGLNNRVQVALLVHDAELV